MSYSTAPRRGSPQSLDPSDYNDSSSSSSGSTTRFGSVTPMRNTLNKTSVAPPPPVASSSPSHAALSSLTSAPSDHFGHFRASAPALAQLVPDYANAALPRLSPFRPRDLFAAHAVRTDGSREGIVSQAGHELYVPRAGAFACAEDFALYAAANDAHALAHKQSTAAARAKQAQKEAALMSMHVDNPAAGAAALAALRATSAPAPPPSDAHLPGAAAAEAFARSSSPSSSSSSANPSSSDAYLQSLWLSNRAKESADHRLKVHIQKLVHEWSAKLSRFEEEVQRRQEDTYYAKFRRGGAGAGGAGSLSQSMTGFDELKQQEEKRSHSSAAGGGGGGGTARAGRRFAEDASSHHRREAFTSSTGSSTEPWALGIDPPPDSKAVKVSKESSRLARQMHEHRMATSIAASTLSAPKGLSALQGIMAQVQGDPAGASGFGGSGAGARDGADEGEDGEGSERAPGADGQLGLTFSAFRSGGGQRDGAGAGADEEDGSASRARLPAVAAARTSFLPSLSSSFSPPPLGFAVRQLPAAPFAGVPGHGHPSDVEPNPYASAHVYAAREAARTAGIAQPLAPATATGAGAGAAAQHVQRRRDMLEVDRIKDRLASMLVAVPRGVLERALVPPEMTFTQEQQQEQLPTPFFGLPSNPFVGGGGKKKKGKSGKKKGKKK